jgi:hypothetical protein
MAVRSFIIFVSKNKEISLIDWEQITAQKVDIAQTSDAAQMESLSPIAVRPIQ